MNRFSKSESPLVLLSFSYPVSHEKQNLGQCPKRHEFDPTAVPTYYLFPNTMETKSFNRLDIVPRITEDSCSFNQQLIELEESRTALQFGDFPNSFASFNLGRKKQLKQRFNVTLQFRTYYPNGLLLYATKKKKTGNCLLVYLKDGQLVVKLQGNRPQELVSSLTNLNDGSWHSLSIVKAEKKLLLEVDDGEKSKIQVPKIKSMSKLFVGWFPEGNDACWPSEVHKLEKFKGCIKNVIVNSHLLNYEGSQRVENVNPCFRDVEIGTFFKAGSHAVYTYNFTLRRNFDLDMEFRSDSKNGLLAAFIAAKISKHPSFFIFIEDGRIFARETFDNEYVESSYEFSGNDSVCNGHWHRIRIIYERGSITLRVDDDIPIFAVAEPSSKKMLNANEVVGALYFGGLEEGAFDLIRNHQFHGCMKNVSVNGERKDWTDMAHLSNVFLNSCPSAK